MNKGLLISILFISAMFLVAAQDTTTGIGAEDAEKMQEAIDTYSPLDESGEVDFEKYKPFKSNAEERIDNINLWLTENASWLKIIFGMVPSISWLFAINLYLLLLFLTVLVLNGSVFNIIASGKKIDLVFFETGWGNILGLIVFILLDATKIIAKLATAIHHRADILWNIILPWGFAIAVITAIFAGGVAIALLRFAPQVLLSIKKRIDAKKEAAAKEETDVDREVLGKIVSGATQTA